MNLKINSNKDKPLIILAPLDWGLGHTTRCIPIIEELIQNGCEVIVACNSMQKTVLHSHFPSIQFVELEGYHIRYGKNRLQTFISIIFQISKLLMSIKSERQWLSQFLHNKTVHAVISDNRYGFYSRDIPSIIITHQLQVKTGASGPINRLVSTQIRIWINRFKECWVPDLSNQNSIAGELSNPRKMPRIPVHYFGCLSRLNSCDEIKQTIPLLVVLSGPEPQRTILESILVAQLHELDLEAIVVRGLAANNNDIEDTKRIQFYNLVNGAELNRLVCAAQIIICRSGYTSLMDYLKLKKRMIVIPTPGQSEQEYLADRLHRQQQVLSIPQHSFRLGLALQQASIFPYRFPDLETDGYKALIKIFIDSLRTATDRNNK